MIDYETTLEGIGEGDLDPFFVGWPRPPNTETRLRHLRGSEHVVLAWDRERGRLVGFVSAVGDGALVAYVPFLEVLPDYQGHGVGTELVRRMLALLGSRYMVDLSCDEELVPFYERFGMRRLVGMGLRNPDAIGP